ncbi:MAG: ATP-binding protein [Aggregatilineales bacterium]
MTSDTLFERLNTALEELQSNKQHFSDESYGVMLKVLVDARRDDRTIDEKSHHTSEIRLVTVMFVDVYESTRLAHDLDAGDWMAMIVGAHDRISEVVSEWDGEVGQYLGDGVLCFFGAQHSQADDALRCVSCALAIQDVINAYANEVFLLHGIEFAVRVGISTGRVVVGMIGNEVHQELLAMGLTTNLAARLQSIADPGEILVDATTYSRVRDHFVVTPRPAVPLRGFEDPVPYYVILSRDARTTTHFTRTSLRGIQLPFVGRTDEMSYLLANIKDASSVGSIFVTGEVGTGKSRLLQETLHRTRKETTHHFIMVAHYETRNNAWNLIHSLLINSCHLTEDMSPDIILRLITAWITRLWSHPSVPYIAERLATITGILPGAVNSSQSTRENIALLIELFKNISTSENLLIMVDNLQWADSISLRFLQSLAQTLEDTPSIILCSVQLSYMQGQPEYFNNFVSSEILTLPPLAATDTQQLVDLILEEVERVPPGLAPIINERASGNPFFVQELLGMLFENGVFQYNVDGRWRFNLMEYKNVSSLPDSLMGVFQARLDALTLECREVLQVAAIVGQTFWEGILHEILPWHLPPLLQKLHTRGVITRQTESDFEGEVQYSFQHTLYRDVAYEMLPRTRRQRYHHQTAEWLMTRIRQNPHYFPLLIQQLIAAEQYTGALRVSLEATQAQLQLDQPEAALIIVDRGLSLGRNVPREIALPIVCQLWALRCNVFLQIERYEEAVSAAKSALMLLEELPDSQLLNIRSQMMETLLHLYIEHHLADELNIKALKDRLNRLKM